MDRYKRGQRTKIRGPLLFSANDEKQPHRRYNKKQKNKIVYKTGVVTDGIIVHYVYVFVKGWLTYIDIMCQLLYNNLVKTLSIWPEKAGGRKG